jgi:hypothetical protein
MGNITKDKPQKTNHSNLESGSISTKDQRKVKRIKSDERSSRNKNNTKNVGIVERFYFIPIALYLILDGVSVLNVIPFSSFFWGILAIFASIPILKQRELPISLILVYSYSGHFLLLSLSYFGVFYSNLFGGLLSLLLGGYLLFRKDTPRKLLPLASIFYILLLWFYALAAFGLFAVPGWLLGIFALGAAITLFMGK